MHTRTLKKATFLSADPIISQVFEGINPLYPYAVRKMPNKALSDSVRPSPARGGINPLCHFWIFCLGVKIQGLFWNTRFLNTVQNPKIILE
jgi:hypothetical protein